MAFNKFMHPKNIYRIPPDFKELALQDPQFRQYVSQDLSGKVHVDFKNLDALRALTKALLKKDFNLQVEIPSDRLIPTLPSRLNYLLWIEDLIAALPCTSNGRQSTGFDIGTGATCIYPLLGARMNGWSFVATDSDLEAFEAAEKNVEANQLQDQITLLLVPKGCILSEVVGDRSFDFSMCNPPFFTSEEDADTVGKGRSATRPLPKCFNCPHKNEAITDGGEVAFVQRMVDESLELKDKIKIYTTLLGKKQSLKAVKRILHERMGQTGISIATTEFCQGNTMRWGIAWSFIPRINLEVKVQPMKKPKNKTIKPVRLVLPNQTDVTGKQQKVKIVLEKVEKLLLELQITFSELKTKGNFASLRCTAMANTWSHQRKKRRSLMREKMKTTNGVQETQTCTEGNLSDECVAKRKADDRGDLEVESRDFKRPNADVSFQEEKLKQDEFLPQCSSHAEPDVASDSCPTTTRTIANVQNQATPSGPAIEFLLSLHHLAENVVLELQYVRGVLGKDGLHQILQYFKNKLNL